MQWSLVLVPMLLLCMSVRPGLHILIVLFLVVVIFIVMDVPEAGRPCQGLAFLKVHIVLCRVPGD